MIRPAGLILNHKDPSECYVLFPPAVPMKEIVGLAEDPYWVGTSMQLGLHKPPSSLLSKVSKLLQDKALEEGEDYEYIPIQPLDPGGPGKHSLPKKGEDPAAAHAFPYQLKQMPIQEHQQIMPSLQQEMKSRQDAPLGSAHDVSAVLHM